MDNSNTWTRLSVEESISMTEDRKMKNAVTIDPVTVKIANWLLIRQPEQ